ncbi:bifunctional acetate--CoA ligase family protein/GNAT family N-acetyltransferase [Actinocatenispora comari]|uniref:GNAT family N-acetyltransferase n=1 Tax=Actinocatenispora comari TaxID=2807577 RepID=A0A8J4A9J8_9ACTN|nr:bifunctional GNAT family N-acetyltransferase/acetate--CoA ligase family protein [Actinocatenispora comari]GIL27521.1 GNAT family N-acetyltransferase [Actinocatenispora comari]
MAADDHPADRAAEGYPADRAADVALADGGTVHLRPIRPEDAPRIVAMHSRFSERTRYLRYFSPYPRIPERDLRRFTTVDHHDREAFVAELGGELIAVGRYERIDADEAEVAFVVEDAHQGRGLGSVLLEHLTAAAGQEHIARFVAEVLPENGTMLRVFSDAGYTVDRSYADGVVHLTFEIAPTERSVEVARDREQRTEAAAIRRLLTPRTVAVVGASTRPGTIGHTLLRNLTAGSYTGTIVPIHPTAKTVRGLRAYPSVAAAPEPIDLALVAVPAEAVPAVVADCAHAGVYALVIVSAGFGEQGAEGLARQRDVVTAARANGMRIVGPNCLGIANTDPDLRLNATLAPALPDRGRAGFFCQSGALGVALLAEAHRRRLGLSSFVSAGNRADVSGNDLLQYWLDDPGTDLVLLYLETFGNPRKFARLARRLARRKPVVAVAGRSRPPALAGVGPAPDERSVEALFARSGVIRVDTVPELFDVGLLLAHQPLPGGRRVGVVGNSTALGVLAVEALAAADLAVPAGYPVDVGPSATAHQFATALRRAVADESIDALVAVFVPPLAVPSAAYAEVLVAETAGGSKPVVATFVAGDVAATAGRATAGEPAQAKLVRPGPDGGPGPGTVPAYDSVEEAVRALARVARYAQWRRRPAGRVPVLPDTDPAAARRLIATALAEYPAGIALPDEAAAPILARYGIAVEPSIRATDARGAVAAADRLGYPVALKVAEGPLRHRVDLGGVRLELSDAGDVRRAYADTAARFGAGIAVVVQRMRPPGVACVVDLVEDPAFGPVVGFGLAGVATDLFGDHAWRAAPLSTSDAEALVRAPLAAPLLFGRPVSPDDPLPAHGTDADLGALTDLLVRLGLLADEQPEVRAVQLNPVLAGADGVATLHATVHVGPPGSRPDTGPRRLR